MLFKVNYAVNEPPLLSIHLKNILRIHISKNAVKICTSLIKSQINLFRTYSVKRVLFDVSQFVDDTRELLISSNIIIKFPSIHILSPDLPCDLFNEDFSCNKSERFCGGLSITSLSLFQLIRVHTINHANYAFSTTVDRVYIDIAGLNAKFNLGVVTGKDCKSMLESIEVHAFTSNFLQAMFNMSLTFILNETGNDLIIRLPIQINDANLDCTEVFHIIEFLSSHASPTKAFIVTNTYFLFELGYYNDILQSQLQTENHHLSSERFQLQDQVKKLKQRVYVLELQKLSNLLFLSNEHSGYLQVSVDYADHLQQFFCIIRRGILYLYNSSKYFIISEARYNKE